MDIEKEIRKLNVVKGNVRAINKRMKYVHRAAKAAGKIHQWRANEIQEIVNKMISSVDDEIVNLQERRR